jgi:hypothetical protein
MIMKTIRLGWLVALVALGALGGVAQADDGYQGLTQFTIRQDPNVAPCSAWELYKDEAQGADEAKPAEEAKATTEPDTAYTSSCQPGCCAKDVCCEQRCRPCCGHSLLSGFTIEGWIDQGITLNPANPYNRFNGPVGFNDRSDEYQMNQLWLGVHRDVNTRGYGFDIGGGVDFNYGTDSRFMWANGLDDDWSDSYRFYGPSLPQLYMDFGWNDLTVRVGHFTSIIGYEQLQAPENFFYSHTYMKEYGEPWTHTGVLFMHPLGNQWSAAVGIANGWNNWSAMHDGSEFLGGLVWNSMDRCDSLALTCTAGREPVYGGQGDRYLWQGDRFLCSLVYDHHFTNRFEGVFQADYGRENNTVTFYGLENSEWYGIASYLYYKLNCRWSLGFRYEWFSDDDGTRVVVDDPTSFHRMRLGGVPSNWQDISLGLKYQPTDRFIVRSECRWDWVDPLVAVDDGPYDDYNSRGQFLWSIDAIWKY